MVKLHIAPLTNCIGPTKVIRRSFSSESQNNITVGCKPVYDFAVEEHLSVILYSTIIAATVRDN